MKDIFFKAKPQLNQYLASSKSSGNVNGNNNDDPICRTPVTGVALRVDTSTRVTRYYTPEYIISQGYACGLIGIQTT